ncbi:unnamed protein product [Macrosiphum euphorbiae]|uniref:Uncharacterized protein n=1 Tax=Macrosiphum euphorbiae TaxID=13131 RepID=A0AAV0XYT2_9HEMI|nr:unnamed protein product [Macrosiphum euphorbiae]
MDYTAVAVASGSRTTGTMFYLHSRDKGCFPPTLWCAATLGPVQSHDRNPRSRLGPGLEFSRKPVHGSPLFRHVCVVRNPNASLTIVEVPTRRLGVIPSRGRKFDASKQLFTTRNIFTNCNLLPESDCCNRHYPEPINHRHLN